MKFLSIKSLLNKSTFFFNAFGEGLFVLEVKTAAESAVELP